VLEVFVVEDDSLNGRYDVLDGGNIIFPKVGKIQVAGKTSVEIETILKKLLETNQLRTATVMVERPAQARVGGAQGKTVFISGNVGSPGRHTVPSLGDLKPTIYQAILDAGGFSRFADQNHVLVTRRGPDGRVNRFKVDAQKIRDGSGPDVPVEDGDMIFVPEKAFGW
jgi:polysaccharide export outer membrane protein